MAHVGRTVGNTGRRLQALLAIAIATTSARAFQASCTTERVNVNSAGVQSSDIPYYCALSTGGRFAVFDSGAPNLVGNDSNSRTDVFVRDLEKGLTERASVSSSGGQGDGDSGGFWSPSAITPDGRYVAFASYATNLVPGDTNWPFSDVFVRDMTLGLTERVSLDSAGQQSSGPNGAWGPSISADARYVAFAASNLAGETVSHWHVYVRDRINATTVRVSSDSAGVGGNDDSYLPSISADGRYVAFASAANNLVASDNNNREDVFVRDLVAGTTLRVNVSPSGVGANGGAGSFVRNLAISGDGRVVVFDDWASNLVAGDANGTYDVFARDLTTGVTELVSVSSAGVHGNLASVAPDVSADGRRVVFESYSDNLVAGTPYSGYTRIFARDRLAGTTELWSVSTSGAHAAITSHWPSISPDGTAAGFQSLAFNLVPGDTNLLEDMFVRRCVPQPTPYCTAKVNSQGCTPAVQWTGSPSASSPSAFDVGAALVLNHKNGILFYGFGPKATAFHDGWMCVRAPIRRTPIQSSGGNAPPDDCSGVYTYNFNARIQSGEDPSLAPGVDVYCEYWYRDPADPRNDGFSNALTFTILN